MKTENCCEDWEPQTKLLNAPFLFLWARNPNTYKYEGKTFKFCPWCGKSINTDINKETNESNTTSGTENS